MPLAGWLSQWQRRRQSARSQQARHAHKAGPARSSRSERRDLRRSEPAWLVPLESLPWRLTMLMLLFARARALAHLI